MALKNRLADALSRVEFPSNLKLNPLPEVLHYELEGLKHNSWIVEQHAGPISRVSTESMTVHGSKPWVRRHDAELCQRHHEDICKPETVEIHEICERQY